MSKSGSLVVAVTALALFSAVASASPTSDNCRHSSPIIGWIDNLFDITPDCGGSGGKSTTAPEIDAASTISAASLLLGGLLVLRGRKARS